jgi:SNF2 family DNA or RNA helicase
VTDLLELTGSAQERRWHKAARVKGLKRVNLPHLADWNYDACPQHDEPTPSCEWRACGFDPFDHQTVSASFLLMSGKAIDASATGTGKTNSILLTLCLAKHLGEPLRAVLVVPTSAVAQWAAETARFAPGLKVSSVTAGLPRSRRVQVYANRGWEVLILGFHLATRDIDVLERIAPRQVISDDVDPILQTTNKTHKAMVRLCSSADRVVVANATNLQTRLTQLYAATVLIGGKDVWGSATSFENRYVKKEPVFIPTRDSKGQKGKQKVYKTTGYKNLNDFKAKFTPMMIRHRYEDLSDLRIPDIVSQNIYVTLHPAQREKYEQLQEGVLELRKKDMPPQQKEVSALSAWTHGGQICAGLSALGEPDGPGASVKLDWTVDHIAGEWVDQKVVVYARNRGTIEALHDRLDTHGIGYATIWGAQADSEFRAGETKRFWQDPACRVMVISAAGERSLNLQNASVLVSIDLNLNPARVQQILGRIRRAGSAHTRVFAISLLASDTQEDRYMTALASRQALFDAVHDEDSGDLFERLEPETLLRLISP